MSYKMLIRRVAESQLREAYEWYESRRYSLGAEFLLSFEATLSLISKEPGLFGKRYKDVRCALTPRFPYGIFYFLDGEKIVVTAVFHLSRNPRLWKNSPSG